MPIQSFDAGAVRTDAGRLLTAVVVNAALFSGVFACLTIGFDSNDDIGMAHIVAGVTTGTPSAEIVFSNIVIGRILKQLYLLTNRINWYTLYLVGVHFAAMTGLLYAFLRIRTGRAAVFLFVLLFFQFEIALLLSLQFTSTAIIAGIAGLLLVLVGWNEESGRSRFAIGYGGALIVLAGMVRSVRCDALFYAVILMSPLIVYEFCGRKAWTAAIRLARQADARRSALAMLGRPWTALKQTGRGGLIAAFIGVAVLATVANTRHYRADTRWRAFLDYTAARAFIHDLPIVEYSENTRYFFNRIGWSRNDWGMFLSWFFSDPEVYSYDHLRTILDRFQGGPWGRSAPAQYLEESLRMIKVFPAMMAANLVLAFLLCRGGRLRLALIGLCQWLLVEALFAVLSWYAKLPFRVVIPAFFASTVVIFALLLRVASERRLVLWRPVAFPDLEWIAAAATIAFCPYYAFVSSQIVVYHLRESAANRHDQSVYRRFVRQLRDQYVSQDSQAIFFNWRGTFPLHFTPPFDDFRDLRPLKMLGLGWNTHSPLFDDAVRRLQLGNLYQATYEKPNIYLISARTDLKLLAVFAWEHYQQRISIKRSDTFLIDSDFPPDYGASSLGVFQMEKGTRPSDFLARGQPTGLADDVLRPSP